MVGNNLQYACFPNSGRRHNESPSTCCCNAIYLDIAGRVLLCVLTLVFGLYWQPNSTFAQSTADTVRSAVHRAGKLPERGNRLASEQVRHASLAMNDSMDDAYLDAHAHAHDEATLTPAASNYEAIDMRAEGACCNGCGAVPEACCCHPFGWLLDWSRGDLWLGTTSFTGAGNFLGVDAGDQGQVSGNFGFQEGFNFGTRLPGVMGGQLGSQIGMRFTQSQLDGTAAGNDSRQQTFVTAGLFRRVDYGLQGGLVVDYLHDDWVYKADLLQLRGELSFLFSPCHDFGFRFTENQQTDDTQAYLRGRSLPVDLRLSSLNTYRFFYRARMGERGASVAELQAGFSEDSAAILGANFRIPLQNQLGLDLNANYLMPPSDSTAPHTLESWNLNIALVWTPGRCFGGDGDYYRPLLDVGHNGNFLIQHVSE